MKREKEREAFVANDAHTKMDEESTREGEKMMYDERDGEEEQFEVKSQFSPTESAGRE